MAKIDSEKCIGCGTCVALCGKCFELGEDGKAKIKKDADPKDCEECIDEVIEACPQKAISK